VSRVVDRTDRSWAFTVRKTAILAARRGRTAPSGLCAHDRPGRCVS
jgi:hypothetical protein